MSRYSGMRIDVALGAGTAIAVAATGRILHRAAVPFTLPAEPDGAASTIGATLQALAGALGEAVGHAVEAPRARVVLLPPLADARLIPLPPLRPAEAAFVVRRDAARYFLGDAGPRTIGLLIDGRDTGGRPVLAAATPVALAEAIRAACGYAGWTLESIVPAHAAWLARARGEQGRAAAARAVLAVEDDAIHVFRTENDAVTVVRRVALSATADAVAAAGAGPGAATVFAGRADREPFVRALSAAGWTVSSGPAETQTAPEAAAAGAADAAIELVPPTLEAQRRRRRRTTALRMTAAAMLLVVGAALIELWGAKRELASVQASRAAIRADVAPLLASRDSIARLGEWTNAVGELEAAAPRWTRALFDLALLLPHDTWVNALRTDGDTLVIEATGTRASAALQSLRRAGSLTNVRLVGGVQRELEDGTTTTERFVFSAVLTPAVEPDGIPTGTSVPMTAEMQRATAEKPLTERVRR